MELPLKERTTVKETSEPVKLAVGNVRVGSCTAATRGGYLSGQLVAVQFQRERVRPVRSAVAAGHGPDVGSGRIHLFYRRPGLGSPRPSTGRRRAGILANLFIFMELKLRWLGLPVDAFQLRKGEPNGTERCGEPKVVSATSGYHRVRVHCPKAGGALSCW